MRTRVIALFISAVCMASTVQAEELNTLLKKVEELTNAGDYTKALEELSWAKKEIEKKHLKKLEDFFPAKLGEYSGDKTKTTSAMGMTSLERQYNSGNKRIRLSLAGGGGKDSPLAALGGLGQMAAMYGGNQPGVESFRIDGRTAMLQSNGRSPELTVFLESGSMLKIEVVSGEMEGEELKKLVDNVNLDDLDNYLRG